MTLTTGRRLGPYQVLAPLGAGGMGEVYRAPLCVVRGVPGAPSPAPSPRP